MKPIIPMPYFVAVLMSAMLFNQSAVAADVKITPLGSQQGEFCQLDRAMILEDPDGTRPSFDGSGTCTNGC